MHPNKPRILVIMPAYNEARVIYQTITELTDAGYEVVVVDDASTDETGNEVKRTTAKYLLHSINLGQGAALMTGMVYAREKNYDYVIHFDADGQHRVEDIPVMLAPVLENKTDIVLGSRFISLEGQGEIPRKRKILLKAAIWVNYLFTGILLTDAHNGFRVLNHKAFTSIQLRENGMTHATEILTEIRRHHLRYCEVPVEIRYSEYARNKGQSAWNSLNILSDLIVRKIFS